LAATNGAGVANSNSAFWLWDPVTAGWALRDSGDVVDFGVSPSGDEFPPFPVFAYDSLRRRQVTATNATAATGSTTSLKTWELDTKNATWYLRTLPLVQPWPPRRPWFRQPAWRDGALRRRPPGDPFGSNAWQYDWASAGVSETWEYKERISATARVAPGPRRRTAPPLLRRGGVLWKRVLFGPCNPARWLATKAPACRRLRAPKFLVAAPTDRHAMAVALQEQEWRGLCEHERLRLWLLRGWPVLRERVRRQVCVVQPGFPRGQVFCLCCGSDPKNECGSATPVPVDLQWRRATATIQSGERPAGIVWFATDCSCNEPASVECNTPTSARVARAEAAAQVFGAGGASGSGGVGGFGGTSAGGASGFGRHDRGRRRRRGGASGVGGSGAGGTIGGAGGSGVFSDGSGDSAATSAAAQVQAAAPAAPVAARCWPRSAPARCGQPRWQGTLSPTQAGPMAKEMHYRPTLAARPDWATRVATAIWVTLRGARLVFPSPCLGAAFLWRRVRRRR